MSSSDPHFCRFSCQSNSQHREADQIQSVERKPFNYVSPGLSGQYEVGKDVSANKEYITSIHLDYWTNVILCAFNLWSTSYWWHTNKMPSLLQFQWLLNIFRCFVFKVLHCRWNADCFAFIGVGISLCLSYNPRLIYFMTFNKLDPFKYTLKRNCWPIDRGSKQNTGIQQ